MNHIFKKRYIKQLIVLLSIVLLISSIKYIATNDYLLLKRIKYKLFDNHVVVVETDDSTDISSISIKWRSSKGEKFIYKSGNKTNRIGYNGGEYAFKIYYKDSLIKEVGHYKNRWDNTNNYYFKIYNDGKINASFKVIGPDSISQHYWDEVLHTTNLNSSTNKYCHIITTSDKDTLNRNVIDIKLDSKDFEKLENNENSKFSIKNASISINNHPLELRKIKIAGVSTLKYRRKSFKISLDNPHSFNLNGYPFIIENFRLVSLSMDPYYTNMFISYSLMKEIGMFDLYFSYVELKINNQTQGIYLLIEEPDHYALKRKNNEFILRRDFRYSSFYSFSEKKELEFEGNHKNDSLTDNDYIQSFHSIYSSLNKSQNKDLFESLNKLLDVNKYMRWMAFNYFLCNGDYTDELYLYSKNIHNTIKFDIIPWDYDDILRVPPHEGWDYRHLKIGDKLIYSIEDSLDLKIANDFYLYSQYLNNLNLLLETINEETIKKVFNDVNIALTPYIKREDIISMSRYDKIRINNYDEFMDNLNVSYLFLIERRKIIINRLQQNNNRYISHSH